MFTIRSCPREKPIHSTLTIQITSPYNPSDQSIQSRKAIQVTNFDPSKLDWTSGLLSGWTYTGPVNKWFQGSFRHAHRLTRQCPTCRDIITLDVTTKALEGEATNHGLSLRRCKKCRAALKSSVTSGDYAERKAIGTARRAAEPEEVAELEKLRKENAELQKRPVPAFTEELETVKKERDEYAENVMRLVQENGDLRRRLAKFELPAALEAEKRKFPALPPEPLTMEQSTARLRAAQNKMPWGT